MSGTVGDQSMIAPSAHVDVDIEKLKSVLSETFGVVLSVVGDEVSFEVVGRPDISIADKTLTEVNEVLACLRGLRQSESLGFSLVSEHSAEIAVDDTSGRIPLRARLRGGVKLVNDAEGLIYEVAEPSPEFAIAFAALVADVPKPERGMIGPRWYRPASRDGDPEDAFELISRQSRFTTVRVSSTRKRTDKEWLSLSESLYFHLGFNLDLALVPRQSLGDLLHTSRVQRMRRGRAEQLDPPRRTYDPTLVRSYQVGVGSESAMLAYLSFYHVAEHWFEDVFLDDVAAKVQGAITSPDFSARRKKDLRNIITTVSKSLRARDEAVVINEMNALELTLRKFIDLGELRDVIEDFDPKLLEYYRSTVVAFSNGDVLDFIELPEDKQYKRLAQRIYKTRNALVHRKDGEKSRYTPFKDDRALRKELPLMRFIAEQIVIASSTVL